jgi:hypothetical protein
MLVKIHEAYRKIIAICDSELLGKKLEQDNLQLDVKEGFYKGKELKEQQVLEIIEEGKKEDACFNIVGKESINIAIKSGIIDEKSIITIQKIPHALSLL